jgi:diguanylate cyclase (GGDEF)-like protein
LILGIIVFLGWWIIFEVIFSIVKVNLYTKKTLEKIGHSPLPIPNEVESLESLINTLSSKVKDSFEQLKEFSQKTEDLNKEVSKKVFVLSTILQANDLFFKNTPSEEIIKFLLQRLKEILNMELGFCALTSTESDMVVSLGIEKERIKEVIEDKLEMIKEVIIYDKERKTSLGKKIKESLGIENIVVVPLISEQQLIGIVGAGNKKENYNFSSEELNIINLFSQDILLIWEHRRLSLKVDELEIFDYLTGLYNEKFIINRLDEEIKRAITYQRPCGFLLMEIQDLEKYQKNFGTIETEKLLKKIAHIFKESLGPIDVVGRIGANKLGAILIERNKRQSQELASKVEEKLNYIFKDKVKLNFAVAENPVDGTTAYELIQFANVQLNPQRNNEVSKEG